MRSFTARILSLFVALVSLPLLAQQDAETLLKNPKYAAKDRKPVFKKMTAEELRSAIKVTSSRNSAWFGFNDVAIEVHLPRVDNSNWIDDDFSEPKLFDKKKREVKYEKEQGIYSHETWSTEIRFSGVDKKPLDFAKAVGSVRIKYPLSMKTRSVKKSDKNAAEAGITFDGPFIKVEESKIAESAFGSDLDGVRAYDKSGKRLEKVMGYSSNSWVNEVAYRGYAFHGDVARVDFDVVDEWATVDVSYEMPPVPKLPESMSGTPSKAPDTIVETPGGVYNVKIVAPEAQ